MGVVVRVLGVLPRVPKKVVPLGFYNPFNIAAGEVAVPVLYLPTLIVLLSLACGSSRLHALPGPAELPASLEVQSVPQSFWRW